MLYKVTKQYLRGSETNCAEFSELKEAMNFVEAKVAEDASLNIKVIYRIHELGEVIKEYDSTKTKAQPVSDQSAQDAAGMGAKSGFQPTPFNMAPRPGGTPPKWLKDEEDDKEK
ncbi:MAG: hypothetical protein A3F14_04795 [Gammaproteobacteria bacterium RIFCSPHIGHO2_12_FULL_43_28]|nr:MAG: hypothetical protein A3F14_04795 [Gammaproteobacteria bacterium RIFCSPHIGHO2_12_FULL_43_28]